MTAFGSLVAQHESLLIQNLFGLLYQRSAPSDPAQHIPEPFLMLLFFENNLLLRPPRRCRLQGHQAISCYEMS